MLRLLLLLLPLELLSARDASKDTNYVIKRISSCPDVGYYFQSSSTPNSIEPWSCLLCFCQDNGTAVCWKRENRRCDVTSFKHHGIGRKNRRFRRSPFGLTDIFFRDAATDIADKKGDMACKPYESTFSDDCPPADWCIGCTVCDCDSHGNWNCHILSFCPDGKNKTKSSKKPLRSPRKLQSQSPPLKPTKTTIRTTKLPRLTRTQKTTSKPVKRPNRNANNPSAKQPHHKAIHIKKNSRSLKPSITHKATRKPTTKGNNYSLNASDRDTITREILKGVVKVMQRMLNNSQMINNQLTKVLPSPTTIQKRSMDKRKQRKKYQPPLNKNSYYKKHVQPKKAHSKISASQSKPIKVYKKGSSKKPMRYKRNIMDIDMPQLNKIKNATKEGNKYLSANGTLEATATTDNNLKYFIVTEKPHNGTTEQYIYHLIYTTSFNYSHEREVQHSASTGREFDIVATDDILHKSNTSLSSENKIRNDKSSSVEVTTSIIEMKNENQSKNNIFTREEVNNNNLSRSIAYATQPLNLDKSENLVDHVTTTIKILINNFTRVDAPYFNKYTTTKFVNKLKQINGNGPAGNHTQKNFRSRLLNKITDIQKIFKKFLYDLRISNINNNSSTNITKPKRKKFNIMKYLKKFFRKVFRNRNSKNSNNSTLERLKLKNHVVEAICEIFDNCVINKKNKKLIELKINELYIESNNIFRSIKIIKGLLHLIDIPGTLTNNNTKPYFKDDVHKLNYILKSQYEVSSRVLTQNQVTQINYIKNNTQNFIQSVGRFANVLNDIIAMLTSNKDINQLSVRNTKKYYTYNNDSRNLEVTKGFIKLKNMLKKYNLVQNTFMRKMYETINKFENVRENNTFRSQVSYTNNKNFNTTVAIEHFSRNIIENLRKLKNLAELLSSRTRKKRNAVGDDDNVEYLLTLMEYMLKRAYPLDTAPVSDGIDLLIDAIQNAPDIKPTKMKLLEYSRPHIRISRTTKAPNKHNFEEVLSDYNKISNEDSNFFNSSENVTYIVKKIKQDKEEKYSKNQYFSKINFDHNTEPVYYEREFNAETTTNSNNKVVTALSYLTKKENANFQSDSYNFDKFVNEKSNIKKFEVYSSDLEDYESDVANTTEASEREQEVITTVIPATIIEHIRESKRNNNNRESSEGSDGNKRIPLEWLEEGYEQDKKGVRAIQENVTVATTQFIRTFTTSPTILQKHGDVVVSSMTQEYVDEDDKKKHAQWNAEQLLRRKQKELLNSLDYGTEISELEDSDSKDDKDDGFSSYYS